jgi:hypothetical protein
LNNNHPSPSLAGPSLTKTIRDWWRRESSRHGALRPFIQFFGIVGEFLRDSTPARRRSRYGDMDFDWDRRVDTTGATISNRDRLLGMFHSPYQPTEPALFREMMEALERDCGMNVCDFTFIDIGSGKGRALLLAADYPFKRILGVELLPALDHIAQENIAKYQSESQKCFAIESSCGDATEFEFPAEPILLYLFNPLPEQGLRQLLANLESSLQEKPRSLYVLYHNPLLERVLVDSPYLRKVGGTHQYSIFAA